MYSLNMYRCLSLVVYYLVSKLDAPISIHSNVECQNGEGWRYSLGFASVPAIMIILGAIFLPDTPSSLIERGQDEKAREELKKIRGTTDIEEEFKDLVAASESSKAVKHPWASLLKREYRPHFTIQYFPMSVIITRVCNFVTTLVAKVDKFGRRTLFLEGGVQMFLCQYSLHFVLQIVAICIYVYRFVWSWGPHASENFPLEVRSAAQSVNVSVNMIFTFAIAQILSFCQKLKEPLLKKLLASSKNILIGKNS
ncbi:Sugar carrier protein C, partial [Mucuna pruriens]